MTSAFDDTALAELPGALRELLPCWNLPRSAELQLLNVSENATFLARDPGNGVRAVLRVHRPGYHTRAEIASELDWIAALRRDGILHTPAILPARDGRRIQQLAIPGGTRHVVAFAHAAGTEPRPGDDLVPGFRDLGAISARLHAHAGRWPRPAGFTRKTWTFETIAGRAPHWGRWQDALGLTPEAHRLLDRTAARLCSELDAYGTGPDRFGLIHADLRLANLLVAEGRLTVIDFDDCGFGWFLFDFAASVSFFEDDPAIPALAAAWAEGYRGVAPLSASAERMLPGFVMLRRLQLTAWIASHPDAATAAELGPAFTDTTADLAETYLTG